ncbi:hypothetical protein [Olivibacter sp. LS-1]|uniref:hypothetical protein n=1 Tax=Olivibacter sp. LS-1 TaxID=2592345 RepID=UPI00143DB538|nr:hypothetical protein [Olivibacter sp. LS-1]
MKKAKLILAAVAVVIVSSVSYAMANRGNGCPLPSDRPNCHIIPPPQPKPR